MEKIKLLDGTIMEVNGGTTSNQFSITVENLDTLEDILKSLTEENLEKFELLSELGDTLTTFENMYLSNGIIEVSSEENYKITFNLGNVDMVAKRLAQLESTQEEQDIALIELAEIVSE